MRQYSFKSLSQGFLGLLLLWTLGANCSENELLELNLEELMNLQETSKPLGIVWDSGYREKASVVGLLLPFSRYPQYSGELLAAAELAINEINQADHNHKKIRLVAADDAADAEVARQMSEVLIKDYTCQLLIGPVATGRLLGLIEPIVKKYQIPLFTPAATGNILSQLDDNDLVFRLIGSNAKQAEIIIKHLWANSRKPRIAIVHGRDEYGLEMNNGLSNQLKQLNAPVVQRLSWSKLVNYGQVDLEDEFSQLQQEKVDHIILAIPEAHIESFFAHLKQYWVGPLPTIYTSDSIKREALLAHLKKETNFNVYTVEASLDKDSTALRKQLQQRLNRKEINYNALYTYDFIYLFFYADFVASSKNISFSSALREITTPLSATANSNTAKYKTNQLSPNAFPRSLDKLKIMDKTHYSGVSSGIAFDSSGDNSAASFTIKPLFVKD